MILDRDRKIFNFIADFFNKHGYSPTHREIELGCEEPSLNVQTSIRRLKRAGFIFVEEGKSRTIALARYSLTKKGIKTINEQDKH
jgi:SOS-response transcriptional repressor LexA